MAAPSPAPRPEPPEPGATDVRYVVEVRPSRGSGRLALPLLLIGLCVGLFAYRLSVADWHWPSAASPGSPHSTGAGQVAQSAPPLQPPELPPIGETAASDEATPTPPSDVATAEAEKEHERADPAEAEAERERLAREARDEIRREAERREAEQAEIARLKEEEGRRLAEAPPSPRPGRPFGFGFPPPGALPGNPPPFADPLALLDAIRRQHEAEVAALRRRGLAGRPGVPRGGFPAAPGFGPGDDFIARQFEEAWRRHEAMMRELEEAMVPPVPGAFGLPGPSMEFRGRTPEVRRFRFEGPHGPVTGLEMRWGSR